MIVTVKYNVKYNDGTSHEMENNFLFSIFCKFIHSNILVMRPFATLVCLLICFVFVTACKKEGPSNNSGGTVLDKTVFTLGYPGGTVTTTYYYDTQGRDSLEAVNATGPGPGAGVNYARAFEYGADGKLTRYSTLSEGTVSYYHTPVYDTRGNIVRLNVNPVGAYFNYGFAYDADNRLIADSIFSGATNEIYSYLTYGYDENDNITQQETFTGYFHPMRSDGKFTWKYDNKINPFYSPAFKQAIIAMDAAKWLSKNNVLGEYTATENADIPVSYEYFSNGLPKSFSNNYTQNGVKYSDVKTFYYK